MATTTDPQTDLAHDIGGTGTPVVFLHGLTFDRRTWRPIIEELEGSVTSIAIDLPAHGDSGGKPTPLENVAEQIHRLLEALDVERPVVVEDPALGEVIAVRSMVYLALTYDHRLVDGADAARFLVTVKNRLEEGAFEAELGL